ncbi:DUF397 domain-containing protein [Actinacidiphila yeochonensis]|uniref:DUF397 domain-containing protein n=1 Tax=Actinacidiphila yeochonensis TaxID=89050 RepID=UPI0005658B16|nr:DUF397 domain-containing protein [Actinacidiphila yeochonensis]
MSTHDLTSAEWFKSSRSNGQQNCVEVAILPAVVAVRDTKDKGRGPILEFSPAVWQEFVTSAADGAFGLPR